ncbi:MAG: membrane protein insertase YidC [Clostridia bacterium]|nr:membrane protein insertase YidC [Clostridia bacterium]
MARLDYARKKKTLIYALVLLLGVCCIVLSACNKDAGIYDVSDKDAELELTHFVAKFIYVLYENIGNIGWTVVVFTIILKVAFSPFDVWQRIANRKNAKAMERMKPQLEVLQAKYGNDKQKFQQEQMALYKREKYSMFGACLPMLVPMVLFFIIFAGFREMVGWKVASDYQDCYKTFDKVMVQEIGEDWENYIGEGQVYQEAVEKAQKAVYDFYYSDAQVEGREFLWIKNIFSPDSWTPAVPDYVTATGQSGIGTSRIEGVSKTEYELVMGDLIGQGGWGKNGSWNGWILLPFLSLVLSIVSQKLTTLVQGNGEKKEKKSFKEKWENFKNLGQPTNGQGQTEQGQPNMKMMTYMMPVMFAGFALMYSSAFALYTVVNSLMSTLIQLICSLVFKIIDKKQMDTPQKPIKARK